jgi:signal transduction histidine kinase
MHDADWSDSYGPLARDDTRLALHALFKIMEHDLATPIVVLQGVLDQGRIGALSEEEWRGGVESLERIRQIIRDPGTWQFLMALDSMRPAATLEKVAIVPLFDRARQSLSELPRCHGIQSLEADATSGLAVWAHANLLVHVFIHLLYNGCEVAGPGGQVGLNAIRSPRSLRLEIWYVGSESSEREKPRHTPQRGIARLGLTIAHEIVKGYEWTLRHDRRTDNSRSCFSIEVPVTSVVD